MYVVTAISDISCGGWYSGQCLQWLRYWTMSVVTEISDKAEKSNNFCGDWDIKVCKDWDIRQCLQWLKYRTPRYQTRLGNPIMSVVTEISNKVCKDWDIRHCLQWLMYVVTAISDNGCGGWYIRLCLQWLRYQAMFVVTQISDICDRWYIWQFVCWLSHQRVYTCACWLMTVRLNLQSKVIPINSTSVITIQLTQLHSYLHVAGAP